MDLPESSGCGKSAKCEVIEVMEEKGLEKYYLRKRAVRISAGALAAVMAVVSSLALALDFDKETVLFEYGSILGKLMLIFSVALPLAAVVICFAAIPKEEKPCGSLPENYSCSEYYKVDALPVKVIRYLTSLALTLQGTVDIIITLTTPHKSGLTLFFSVLMKASVYPLALYFVPEFADSCKKQGSKLHLVMGTAGITWFVFSSVFSYFSKIYPLSSEYFITERITLILLMLAVVYEIHYRLYGNGIRSRLATGSAAVVSGLGFGVGRLVMLMTAGVVDLRDTVMIFSTLFLSLYFAARLFFYSED